MSAVVQDRRCRENGARIMVIDARLSPDFQEDEADRWITWCDRHETFCQHETKWLALYHAPVPTGWCGLCAEGMD